MQIQPVIVAHGAQWPCRPVSAPIASRSVLGGHLPSRCPHKVGA